MEFKLKRFKIDLNVTKIANVHYFEFIKKYHTHKDSHKFNELIYVDSGTIEVSSDNFTGTLNHNQLIIHGAEEMHSLYCREDSAPNVIIIGFECTCDRLKLFSKKPVNLSFALQKYLINIIKEGRNVFLPPYDVPNLADMKKRTLIPFGADQLLKIYLEIFLINLIRETEYNETSDGNHDNTNTRISEIRDYIDKNYKTKMTLDELCFLFGTNKTTLCRDFKSAYGQTVVDYINCLRIKQVKILMREGIKNITEIAEELNFSSIHYLTRLFTKYEGVSPTAYIKTIKSKLEEKNNRRTD